MYFKDKDGVIHFLTESDIQAGGRKFLPAGCIEISEEEATAARSPTLEQRRAQRLAEVNAHAANQLAALSAAYPDGEVQSWAQQTLEAEALAANPSAPSPLLSAIATARGLPLDVLAERVRAKVQAYAVASGQIIGQRQALEDAINAVDLNAPDAAAQLEAIQWPA